MFKTCPICGAEFFTTRADAIYDRPACRTAAYRQRKDRALDHKLVLMISKYPKLGRRIRSILRRYGADAVYMTLRCIETVEESNVVQS